MKKIILSISMAIMSTVAFGQIESGTMFIGGTFSFTSESSETTVGATTTDGPTNSTFQLAPSFGYMITDKIGAGVRFGIKNSKITNTTNNGTKLEDKTNLTTIGAFGRYYLPVAGDALFFHADLGFDIGFGTITDETEQTTQGPNPGDPLVTTVVSEKRDVSSFDLGVRPGFDYFIGEKWAIEMNWGFIGYGSEKTEVGTNAESKSSDFGVTFDFTQFGVGARWYF